MRLSLSRLAGLALGSTLFLFTQTGSAPAQNAAKPRLTLGSFHPSSAARIGKRQKKQWMKQVNKAHAAARATRMRNNVWLNGTLAEGSSLPGVVEIAHQGGTLARAGAGQNTIEAYQGVQTGAIEGAKAGDTDVQVTADWKILEAYEAQHGEIDWENASTEHKAILINSLAVFHNPNTGETLNTGKNQDLLGLDRQINDLTFAEIDSEKGVRVKAPSNSVNNGKLYRVATFHQVATFLRESHMGLSVEAKDLRAARALIAYVKAFVPKAERVAWLNQTTLFASGQGSNEALALMRSELGPDAVTGMTYGEGAGLLLRTGLAKITFNGIVLKQNTAADIAAMPYALEPMYNLTQKLKFLGKKLQNRVVTKRLIGKSMMKVVNRSNLQAWAWTVNSRNVSEELQTEGVKAIYADRTELFTYKMRR